MLHVFTGTDPITVRARAQTLLDGYEERGARIARIGADECTPERLRDRAGARSLFLAEGADEVVVLDMPSEEKEAEEAVCALARELAESKTVFVLLEKKLLAPAAKELKQNATEYHEVAGGSAGEKFNVFALSDALARRDRKSLWVLLLRAREAGLSAEEILGTLFWQMKTMRLATQTKSADEAGLKPFVYRNAKRGAGKFKTGELALRTHALVALYHDAHLGLCDIDLALERWVLEG